MSTLHYMVIAKLMIEGLHFWKDAPEKVEFLRNKHRHTFYIEVKVKVDHADRQIEAITLKHNILKLLDETFPRFYPYKEPLHFITAYDFASLSCESLAQFILDKLPADSVLILEDNEVGGEAWRE